MNVGKLLVCMMLCLLCMTCAGAEGLLCVSAEDTAALLTVQGQDLKLKTLSLEGGQVAVDGQISALIYEESGEGGFWQRLWR